MSRASPRLLHALAVLLALVGATICRAQPDEAAITAAEKLLFQTDHLANIHGATRLEYRYSSNGEVPYDDRVIVSIDSRKSVVADYLTGSRHVDFPGIDDAHGNPLLLYFLEGDLREMRMRTNGRPEYFRRLIRRAMARPDLAVEAVEVSVAGQVLAARRVFIEPFRNDPNAQVNYPSLVGKSYEFVLASSLPGQIAFLASHVPLADGRTDTVRVEWSSAGPL